jgi:hypothetical protein
MLKCTDNVVSRRVIAIINFGLTHDCIRLFLLLVNVKTRIQCVPVAIGGKLPCDISSLPRRWRSSYSRLLLRPRQRKTGAAISTILTTHVSHARRGGASDRRITARTAARILDRMPMTRKSARNPSRDRCVGSRKAQVSTIAIHTERIASEKQVPAFSIAIPS